MKSRAGVTLVVGCLIAGIVAAFAIGPYWIAAVIVDGAAATACGAVAIGASRRRGAARGAWITLAAGLGLWLIGDLIWDWYAVRNQDPPIPSAADIAYIVAYPLMLGAIWQMVRLRLPVGRRDVVIDGCAFGAAAALAAWKFLVTPNVYEGITLAERITLAAYPLGDVLLIMAMTWLALSPGRRSGATRALFGFFGLTLALDLAYALIPRFTDSGSPIEIVNSLYPFAYAFMGVAALHPDAERVTESTATPINRIHPARLMFLVLALTTAPILDFVERSTEPGAPLLLTAIGGLVTALVVIRFVGVVRDREAAREQLEFQAVHDVLTALPNRRVLIERIERAIERRRREHVPMAVLYVDLDRFKAVNDTYGHETGDAVLVEVANRLRNCVRTVDTVARLGGDEFALLCEGLEEPHHVFDIADRIVAALSEPYALDGVLAVVSVSIGIAIPDATAADGDAVLRDADSAMYRAKESGRDRWEVFDAEMRDWVDRRRDTEAALARAIERDELRLFYQPVIDLATGAACGFEALLRWERPGHGLLAPADFIPLAEETGLIVPIGEWVMTEACRQTVLWNDTHLDRAPIGVSVNVSARQLNQPRLRDLIERSLLTSGVDPRLVTLELTETMLLDDGERALAQLEGLKRLGLNIAIDDFGTGYSALSYLRLFPIDVVKIDQSFVQDIGAAKPDTTLVAAVIALSHGLGHRVVAEGVETETQLAALVNLGCDFAQGYYFARPLNTAQASAWLRSETARVA